MTKIAGGGFMLFAPLWRNKYEKRYVSYPKAKPIHGYVPIQTHTWHFQLFFSSICHDFFTSNLHCVKSVQIQSYFWSVFSCIRKIRTRNLKTNVAGMMKDASAKASNICFTSIDEIPATHWAGKMIWYMIYTWCRI